MEINKGIEPFEDQTDFTRGNKDRQQWGKGESAKQYHIGSEFDVVPPTPEAPPTPPVPPPADAPKFTHKLANGTVLEAATIEELATKIEKSLVQAPPAPVDFEDKPLYTPMEFKRKELTLAEQAEILNVWKENPQKASRMLQEAEFGAPLDTILQNLSRAEQRELNRRQEEAGVEFIFECEAYNPTRENAKKLTDLIHSKQKPITKHNLTVAFQQLSATDKSLVRAVDPPPPDPTLSDAPPPPSHLQTNMGRSDAPPPGEIDVTKFAAMSLGDQQKIFARMKRGT